jgi:hypothetical protein
MKDFPSIERLAVDWSPLPRPLITHLLSFLSPKTTEKVEEVTWQIYLQRSNVFDRFHPNVVLDQQGQQNITIRWLLEELSAVLNKQFARSTLFNWHQRGFLEYEARGCPRAEDAARLLLFHSLIRVFSLSVIERDVLPSTLQERNAWCWRQENPNSPAIPYMLPLQEERKDLFGYEPKRDCALFWTPWPGAAWDQGRWLQCGGMGAVSCGFMLFHSPATLDYTFLSLFLPIWYPQGFSEIPYFRDISYHGHKFQRFDLPDHIIKLLLWQLAASRLWGPTFNL